MRGCLPKQPPLPLEEACWVFACAWGALPLPSFWEDVPLALPLGLAMPVAALAVWTGLQPCGGRSGRQPAWSA